MQRRQTRNAEGEGDDDLSPFPKWACLAGRVPHGERVAAHVLQQRVLRELPVHLPGARRVGDVLAQGGLTVLVE